MVGSVMLFVGVGLLAYCIFNIKKYGDVDKFYLTKKEFEKINKKFIEMKEKNEILGGIIGDIEIDDLENCRNLKIYEEYNKNNEEIKCLKKEIKNIRKYIYIAEKWVDEEKLFLKIMREYK